jgi:restriction system protein
MRSAIGGAWPGTRPDDPTILLQSTIVVPIGVVPEGQIVVASRVPLRAIAAAIRKDAGFLRHFSKHHREFEEFLAAAYSDAGFDEVVLTPRSNDEGRDLIAIRRGVCEVRILGQAKAYAPGHRVTRANVDEMLGVMSRDPNATKAVIVTTSEFAPGIAEIASMQLLIPTRLELVDGEALPRWLDAMRDLPMKVADE